MVKPGDGCFMEVRRNLSFSSRKYIRGRMWREESAFAFGRVVIVIYFVARYMYMSEGSDVFEEEGCQTGEQ